MTIQTGCPEQSLFSTLVCILCTVVVTLSGCDKSFQIGEVEGVLLVSGRPARKVRIEFVPEGISGPKAPTSMAETDEQGKFTLQLIDGNVAQSRPGAVVGFHRVALTDLQIAESPTGRGIPVRFGSKYMLPSSTPLYQEVKEGKQTIEIKIP